MRNSNRAEASAESGLAAAGARACFPFRHKPAYADIQSDVSSIQSDVSSIQDDVASLEVRRSQFSVDGSREPSLSQPVSDRTVTVMAIGHKTNASRFSKYDEPANISKMEWNLLKAEVDDRVD